MLKTLSRYFVYSNLFIAGCAIARVYQSFSLFEIRPNFHLVAFVFFSTICSYSFHWWLTGDSVIPSSRVKWLKVNRPVHLALFFIGLAGAACFFFYLLPWWHWLLIGAIVTFFYSAPKIPHPYFRALRKVALGKTIFLAFVWMYVTTILPIVTANGQWLAEYTLFAISRFFLIYAICILFDYRDRADDKAAGIRSLITYLGERSITWLFAASLAIFFISTLLLLVYDYTITTVILLLIPGVLTAALYNYARRHFSDMFYYFVLDGLMALSAVLMLMVRG
jgi:1,4-dihydroxy-2-naphthoate octaprenyltransferase